jgi:hypothetical protein
MKYGQKLKLGDAHVTPRNIQEVQASNLGDAPEAPLLHRQKSGHLSTHYIFIASYSMRFSWSALLLLSVLFCFVFCNKWFLLENTHFIFHCQEHSIFTLIVQRGFFFLELRLAFVFLPLFHSDLVISLHQGVFIPLVYVGFHQKSCFKKV